MYYLFSILDEKTKEFSQPYVARSDAEMTRQTIGTIMGDPNHTFYANAEDYTLYEIGTFDPSSASIESYEKPKKLAAFTELREEGDKRAADEERRRRLYRDQ